MFYVFYLHNAPDSSTSSSNYLNFLFFCATLLQHLWSSTVRDASTSMAPVTLGSDALHSWILALFASCLTSRRCVLDSQIFICEIKTSTLYTFALTHYLSCDSNTLQLHTALIRKSNTLQQSRDKQLTYYSTITQLNLTNNKQTTKLTRDLS